MQKEAINIIKSITVNWPWIILVVTDTFLLCAFGRWGVMMMMMMIMFMYRPRPVPSQPRGSMVGVFWLQHITVREGFGCNTQQLGSSFYCNTLQFKLGSQCGIRALDRWLYRFDSAYVCVHFCVCLFLGLYYSVCVCACACTCVFLSATRSVCVWAHVSVLSLSTYLCVCVCLLVSCLSVSTCLHLFMCVFCLCLCSSDT